MKNRRILILEDEEDSLFILKSFFKKQNYIVETSETVTSALEILDSKMNFDLFIVDYFLPDGLGGDFIDEIRKRLILSPVILCSAYSNLKLESNVGGVIEYVPKPIELKVLNAAIIKLLQNN